VQGIQRALLPPAKGLLIIGIAGTGKSLSAKVTAQVFGVPLLKLDAGRLYGGLVGQSEANLRSVIQTAEAIAPCVVWLDEIEKGLAGSKSSGSTAGGTSVRVLGSLLAWMSEIDTVQLARASDGLTGSEIEAVFVDSLYNGFDRDTEPTDLDIARVLTDFVPLSKTMAEQITAMRTWAAGRARFASSPTTTGRRLRKLAA
jgi:hypothetical protein